MNASLIANYVTAARRVCYLELHQKDYATMDQWHKALTYAKHEERKALTVLSIETGLPQNDLMGDDLNKIMTSTGYAFLNQMEEKYTS